MRQSRLNEQRIEENLGEGIGSMNGDLHGRSHSRPTQGRTGGIEKGCMLDRTHANDGDNDKVVSIQCPPLQNARPSISSPFPPDTPFLKSRMLSPFSFEGRRKRRVCHFECRACNMCNGHINLQASGDLTSQAVRINIPVSYEY